jgi:hypothetical protein
MANICFFPKDLGLSCPHEKLVYQILKFSLELDLEHLNTKGILKTRLFSTIFLKKDKILIEKARNVFQIGFLQLISEFNQKQEISTQVKHDYLNRVLCLLPYLEFDSGATITLPWFDSNHWTKQTFTLSKIRLSEKSIWQNPYDRAYAYGLDGDKGDKVLIFPGTTYPAGEGFFSHIMTDLDGFHSVGQTLLDSGSKNISDWVKSKKESKVFTLGTSLGGSMALLWSQAFPDICKGVFAFNPPGMLDVPKTPKEKTPPARILIQEYDLVSQFGYWHPDWELIQVKAPTNPFFHRSGLAHALTFIGQEECTYKTLAVADENQKRYWFNLLLFKITRCFIYISVVLPIYYVIKPIWSFIYQELNWIIIASIFLLSIFSFNPIFCIFMGFMIKEFIKLPSESFQFENLFFIASSLIALAAYFFIAKSAPILLIPIIAYLFTQVFANLFNDNQEPVNQPVNV